MIFSLMMKIFLNILWRCERILSINILLLLWWQRIFFQFQHLMLMLNEFLILLMMSVIIIKIILIQIQLRWLCWWSDMRSSDYENLRRILIHLMKRKNRSWNRWNMNWWTICYNDTRDDWMRDWKWWWKCAWYWWWVAWYDILNNHYLSSFCDKFMW